MKTPLDLEGLEELVAAGLSPRSLVRPGEAAYAERGLDTATDDELLAAIVADPSLMQRPIVLSGGKAAIGRPPEAVLEIL